MKHQLKQLCLLFAALSLCAQAFSQDTAQQAGPVSQAGGETDPVFLFNEICYSQVPDVSAIADMAKRFAWEPMGGDDLQRFTTIKTPTLLEGWDMRLSERIYRIGIVQSEPSNALMASFPDLTDATATSCSMVLDGQDDAQLIFDRMVTLVGKAPDNQDQPDEALLTTTWSGGNADVKVFVFLKTDRLKRANLMNVTIVTK